ncbi:GrpB family protein [Aliikangiella coralliicola]|uniref:GrpB family protein n=1 Tax=Aliikangiella coralliicola TaxID=2592383 RepID=A0A545U7T8_9GAMM|nr:GrpB family protein [Aliikangiella coralliicola]TQV85473.1 GrpB family protein [Aliikangiella coralliicola]
MISILEYNPDWPDMFDEERRFIGSLLEDFIHGTIEHVGSTAVKGLAAKPVIDIMVGVKTLESSKKAIQIMEVNGYCYHPYKGDVMHWFCKPSPEIRTHHLHLVPFESKLWFERLAFRDYLRSHPIVAQEYAALKRQLARESNGDREKYTREKTSFICDVLKLVSANN